MHKAASSLILASMAQQHLPEQQAGASSYDSLVASVLALPPALASRIAATAVSFNITHEAACVHEMAGSPRRPMMAPAPPPLPGSAGGTEPAEPVHPVPCSC